jgi:chromate transporter
MLIAIVLAALYMRFGEVETLRRILAGIACAAVGLLIAVVLRMTMPLVRKRDVAGMLMLIAVFIAIGVLRLPLQVVLLVAIPVSFFITWFLHKRATT